MATTKTDYSPHKQYVEAHFGWARSAYEAKSLIHEPGLRIEHPQGTYRVETLAERIEVCLECLCDLYAAMDIAADVAALALGDSSPEPDLVEQVLDVMQKYGLARDRDLKRSMVGIFFQVSDGNNVNFWRGVGQLDPAFLAAGLIVVKRAGEPGALARRLADLYFEYPQLLSTVPRGRIGRASIGELELVLYQVAWGPGGEPEPEPAAREWDPEPTAAGRVPKRLARRRK